MCLISGNYQSDTIKNFLEQVGHDVFLVVLSLDLVYGIWGFLLESSLFCYNDYFVVVVLGNFIVALPRPSQIKVL